MRPFRDGRTTGRDQRRGGVAVLIGGDGQDKLIGGSKSDLLIAGATIFDNNHAALKRDQGLLQEAKST